MLFRIVNSAETSEIIPIYRHESATVLCSNNNVSSHISGVKNPAVAGVGRAERLAAQQFVDSRFAARFFIDLFDDDGAVEAVATIRCGQVAGDDD